MNKADLDSEQISEDVLIANGASLSAALDCKGFCCLGFIMPAAFTGASVEIRVSDDGVTYRTFSDGFVASLAYTFAASVYVPLVVLQGLGFVDPSTLPRFIKFLSVTAGVPTAEAASRTFRCLLAPSSRRRP